MLRNDYHQNRTIYLVKSSFESDGKNKDIDRQIEMNEFTNRSSVKETLKGMFPKEENWTQKEGLKCTKKVVNMPGKQNKN